MEELMDFHSRCASKRSFTSDNEAQKVLDQIVSYCSQPSWASDNDYECKLVVFQCLRLLLRDEDILRKLETTKIVPLLCQDYGNLTQKYLQRTNESHDSGKILSDIIIELTNIIQKLSTSSTWHEILIECECHNQMMTLLSCSDQVIFQSSLLALINLSKTAIGRGAVLDLCPLYSIIDIITNHDSYSRLLASDLFILLSLDHSSTQQQIKDFDLLPSCLMLIQSTQTEKVKQKIFKALQKVLLDEELLEEFHVGGGIPILVKVLSIIDKEQYEYLHSILQFICTLCVYDPCAKQIVECNGLYYVASYLVGGAGMTEEQRKLNSDVLRTLRYLFSLESNRRLLKRLFPTSIFEAFIDVGHYVFALDAYSKLCMMLDSLTPEETITLQENIASLDKMKEPIGSIGGYSLLEVLGKGAYGVVYRVSKGKSGSFYAMKEISMKHPALGSGRSQKERAEKTERIVSEVAMTQKNLSHSNVVRFYKCFQESENIYIVMSLIEGASLSDHITSLKEKAQTFTEKRIWKIFSQLILGLRYLHEQRRIVHRDLKPANIMVGERDKATITDFGLAKEHNEFSVLKSVVGTMLYWCPELVQNEPYDKKADIWAAGCVLYEMAALSPPFSSGNMLILAKKIAEIDYDLTQLREYSPLLREVVEKCFKLDPTDRPDSIQIGGMIVEHMMNHLDSANVQCENMEKKLSREREKTLRHKQELLNTESRRQSRRQLTFSPVRRTTSTATISDSILSQSDVFLPSTPPAVPHYTLNTVSSPSSVNDSNTPLKQSTATRIGNAERRHSYSPSPSRPTAPRSPLLSLSSSQLREISDPIEPLMIQIHKLIYVSQLPPTPKPSSCCLIVMQYKKILFSEEYKIADFKGEIQKLSSSSSQPVVCFPPSPRLLSRAIQELKESVMSNHPIQEEAANDSAGVLTYELLHGFIEDILKGTSYYSKQTT